MLDDGSAAVDTLLLFEIAADDQAKREEQAGRQETGGGELTMLSLKISPSPSILMITSDSTSPPQ